MLGKENAKKIIKKYQAYKMLKYEKGIKASSSLSFGPVPQPKVFTVSF